MSESLTRRAFAGSDLFEVVLLSVKLTDVAEKRLCVHLLSPLLDTLHDERQQKGPARSERRFRIMCLTLPCASISDMHDRSRGMKALSPSQSEAGLEQYVNQKLFRINKFAWSASGRSVRTDIELSPDGTRFSLFSERALVSHYVVTKERDGFVRRPLAGECFAIQVAGGELIAEPASPQETEEVQFGEFTRPFG